MNKLFLLSVVVFLTVFLSGLDVFINGTKVTGVKDQEIKNCNLKIDKDGNIFIDAPNVKIIDESAKLTREYYLSVSFEKPLPVEFVFFINGKEALKITKGDTDSINELNIFLKKGENIFSFNSAPVNNPLKFKIIAGTGIKKESSIEFFPFFEHSGEINNLGTTGNFKINAE